MGETLSEQVHKPDSMTPHSVRRWPTRIAVVCLVAVIAISGAVWSAPDGSFVGVILRYGPRWVVVLPIAGLMLVLLAVRAWRATLIAMLTLGISLGAFAGLRLHPLAAPVDESAERLRIMTLNCDGNAADVDVVTLFVGEWQPDLILLQDCGRVGRPESLPKSWNLITGPGGLVLASRYPADAAGGIHETSFGGGDRGADRFVVDSPWGKLTLVNVHLPTPRAGLEAAIHLDSHAGGVIAEQARVRANASETTRAFAGTPDKNLFVAGDFNMPVESPAFLRDWGQYQNAFGSAGNGFGWTMFTSRAVVRIDQILSGPGWECRACWVGRNVGSAHRPLLADFTPAGAR